MRKAFSVIILAICVIFTLCGCGGPTAKTESEILNDIVNQDQYFGDYGLKTISSEITKRQTNEESKTDFVWVTVSGKNDDFSYLASYELIYVLYNDGWLLEDLEIVDSSYEANRVPEQELQAEAESLLEGEFSTYEFVSMENISANSVVMNYQGSNKISDYLSVTYSLELNAYFNPRYGWHISTDMFGRTIQTGECEETWDITGLWTYYDNDVVIMVEISEFDPTSGIVTLQYSWSTAFESVDSDGFVSVDSGRHYGGHRSEKYPYVVTFSSNDLEIRNLPTNIYIAGDIYEINYSTPNCGVFVEIWDGDSWYSAWLSKN